MKRYRVDRDAWVAKRRLVVLECEASEQHAITGASPDDAIGRFWNELNAAWLRSSLEEERAQSELEAFDDAMEEREEDDADR